MKRIFMVLGLVGMMGLPTISSAADAAKGKDLFQAKSCTICHNVDKPDKKLPTAPSLMGVFKRPKMQNGKAMNDADVLDQINNGGNGMPPYAKQLTDDQKADIIAYLHTL